MILYNWDIDEKKMFLLLSLETPCKNFYSYYYFGIVYKCFVEMYLKECAKPNKKNNNCFRLFVFMYIYFLNFAVFIWTSVSRFKLIPYFPSVLSIALLLSYTEIRYLISETINLNVCSQFNERKISNDFSQYVLLRPEIRNSSEPFIFCLFYWKFHYRKATNPLEMMKKQRGGGGVGKFLLLWGKESSFIPSPIRLKSLLRLTLPCSVGYTGPTSSKCILFGHLAWLCRVVLNSPIKRAVAGQALVDNSPGRIGPIPIKRSWIWFVVGILHINDMDK